MIIDKSIEKDSERERDKESILQDLIHRHTFLKQKKRRNMHKIYTN